MLRWPTTGSRDVWEELGSPPVWSQKQLAVMASRTRNEIRGRVGGPLETAREEASLDFLPKHWLYPAPTLSLTLAPNLCSPGLCFPSWLPSSATTHRFVQFWQWHCAWTGTGHCCIGLWRADWESQSGPTRSQNVLLGQGRSWLHGTVSAKPTAWSSSFTSERGLPSLHL